MSVYTFRGTALPDNLKESLDAYIETGRPTGTFLQACIENNLRVALGHGDELSIAALPAIVGYLYNEAPCECWGRAGIFREWINKKHAEQQAVQA